MQTVRRPPARSPARPLAGQLAAGGAGVLVLLIVLAGTVGLAPSGAVVGVGYAVVLTGSLGRAVWRSGRRRLGPADAVTLTRAVLIGGLTALVADSFRDPAAAPVPVLVALASVALALDAVDGKVARRTGTVTAVGARFDMEVDAFLLLVLALYDVRLLGGWVLLIGLARYLFVAASWLLPWLAEPTPPRFWGKVVAAIQGVVLTVAMADLLPSPLITVIVLAALALLVESFGRQIGWLYRHARPPCAVARRSPRRRVAAGLTTVVAAALVWFALVGPDDPGAFAATTFLRIPLEALIVVGVVVAVPPRVGRWVAVVGGVVLGVLTVIRLLNIGFRSVLGRPFNPLTDWGYAGSFIELLSASLGAAAAAAIGVAIVLTIVAVLVGVPLAVRRLTRLAGRDRAVTYRFVGAFAVIWLVCAAVGLQLAPGSSVAAADAARLAYREVGTIRAGVADWDVFRAQLAAPVPVRTGPLAGLRGKDVVIAFVESYGRVTLTDPQISPGVAGVLDDGSRRLAAAGFTARSAFLTSPTFGGISWLAHATLQSGLWVDSQQRYDQLMDSDRPTLTSTFGGAGWRTVLDVPANQRDWPEARTFYRADQVYDAHNVGYTGPSFGFATVPDQYTLAFFQRTELAPANRPPVMAEIDLLTSHSPWTPVPSVVDWSGIGDGAAFVGMTDDAPDEHVIWADPDAVRTAYGHTIEYSLATLISFTLTYGNDDLVLIVLGDHQPAPVIGGDDIGHDVPVTIISRDPAVAAATAGWGWSAGLHPPAESPVWRMDQFHGRFLDAFSE